MSADKLSLTLKIWRQKNATSAGSFETYAMKDVSTHMSFLEMLDVLNETLITQGKDPVAFDHDCREGICGTCGMMINGRPHGPMKATTTCQLHMRSFKDGATWWSTGPRSTGSSKRAASSARTPARRPRRTRCWCRSTCPTRR
jgi:succinate dehydrogenase / fumarate reductase, iron-sulfur subunit